MTAHAGQAAGSRRRSGASTAARHPSSRLSRAAGLMTGTGGFRRRGSSGKFRGASRRPWSGRRASSRPTRPPAFGAALTQCSTGAVPIAAAATSGRSGPPTGLGSVGEVSNALSPVLGASLAAAIVCSLALVRGEGEVAGYKHALEHRPLAAKRFHGVQAMCVVGSAAAVGMAPDLVELNVAAQVLNAVPLPLAIGLLIALALTALPAAMRPKGAYSWELIAVCALVIAVGVWGGLQGVIRP